MKKELKILLFTTAFFTLAGGLFGPIYAVFVEEIGGDLLTAGGAYAAFSLATGILIFLISKWEDRVKHKERLVVGGYFLSCCGFLGYLLIKESWHLFIVQVIFGIGAAITTPAYDGLYSQFLDKKRFVSEWGAWEAMYYITVGIAAMVGGWFANKYGFRILFWIMLLLSIEGFAICCLLLKKQKKKYKKKRKK